MENNFSEVKKTYNLLLDLLASVSLEI